MRLSFAVLFSLLPAILATPVKRAEDIAPLNVAGEVIPDSYIVVFKKGVSVDQISLHLDNVAVWQNAAPLQGVDDGLTHVYADEIPNFDFSGYSGRFSAEALQAIREAPEVAYVERDQIVRTQDDIKGVDNFGSDIETEKDAPWGLARISHRDTLRLGTFNKYVYDTHGGEGVTAYVIDTGVYVQHEEFEGRARWGATIPSGDPDEDGNGHGTHCAGTIGSAKYGVAKAAEIVAVKVLRSNGSGSMSDVVKGVLWAAKDAEKQKKAGGTKHKGSVANMSLGGGKAQSLDDAVDAAVESGLHFAVAAGNDNRDACTFSPAASKLAVTVGASTIGDERAYFSNHGKCVDIFAPGLNIKSTWNGIPPVNTISGTSMASPHIAGLLAYLISIEGSDTFSILEGAQELVPVEHEASAYSQAYDLLPELLQAVLPAPEEEVVELVRAKRELTPERLKKALIALASPGILSDAGGRSLPAGSPNLLAFNNATSTRR
ncbi:Subtilisin-like protease [Vanrija pseudolonga]|uniref:Subtilisin-like protease n=1 Tax=Vanrija pseudolonga TaxID=143232 RepID=A0AAF0Y723_9TREE|nr:Subtilisin-like protease [Vanrija pseudolonga]